MNTALQRLDSGFPQAAQVLEDCLPQARKLLSPEGVEAYLDAARGLGKLGRGAEPLLVFLKTWPGLASHLGEAALPFVLAAVQTMTRSPNGRTIAPLLQSLADVAPRLAAMPEESALQTCLDIVLQTMERTSGSIHGAHKTYASACLPPLLQHLPQVLSQLSLSGLQRWIDFGVRNYPEHPERQQAYFSLQSPDSRAVLQGERQGTLLLDHMRQLELYLRSLWHGTEQLVPFSAEAGRPGRDLPYWDSSGMRLPDVYDALGPTSGIDRYRAALAHMAAHRRWSQALFADNWSPLQRLAVEFFEDARVDLLAMRLYPGLRRIFCALHATPTEGACDPATQSCQRHRLAMLSRALLDPSHTYTDGTLLQFAKAFFDTMAQGESSTAAMANLAIAYVAKTRLQSDQLPNTFFTDTEIAYRDDNRHLWKFHERSDDEEMFDAPPVARSTQEERGLPPRLYPEWDYASQSYRPDWVSLYERLHPSGSGAHIDQLLEKHTALAKRLKRLLDSLKPQDRARLRHQEEGSELDLDAACQAQIDLRCGLQPDTRVQQSSQSNGRSIAVMLVLDLSESLNARAPGSQQSVLELSQEAVSLLAWAVDQLGDPLAIAGFHSNTRHEVRYLHIKGFGERWGDTVKSRLAAMQAGYSTRMGAALRHAAHYLGAQTADKKLMLVLTDGQPADVDCSDARLLIDDARQSVRELEQQGIFSYCINLDAQADAYVADIFGHHYTVMDHVERLPEQLPQLFMALTR
ncbi:hypothetical protein DIC66_21010 [Rhodoferax lacus]|uniref:VWFA domain-containing protein n=1 Tax=Rhodoferax lacus TaxID=2184758 RepID=A0A3E1R695_9BURK|nr:VWA domain-containing protein [Rhodoferax lacus]RFO94885.1 hypothetical protein DIC66_21010 [Rhodoferax lacus]